MVGLFAMVAVSTRMRPLASMASYLPPAGFYRCAGPFGSPTVESAASRWRQQEPMPPMGARAAVTAARAGEGAALRYTSTSGASGQYLDNVVHQAPPDDKGRGG
jgi:hypothetical protein